MLCQIFADLIHSASTKHVLQVISDLYRYRLIMSSNPLWAKQYQNLDPLFKTTCELHMFEYCKPLTNLILTRSCNTDNSGEASDFSSDNVYLGNLLIMTISLQFRCNLAYKVLVPSFIHHKNQLLGPTVVSTNSSTAFYSKPKYYIFKYILVRQFLILKILVYIGLDYIATYK